MLTPLKQFYCDTCNQLIETPEDGWVEWLSNLDQATGKIISRELRICHHSNRCAKHYKSRDCSDGHLDNFLTPEGYTHLLSFLDEGEVLEPEFKGPEIQDIRGFTEILRRLTIPHYEEARRYFSLAKKDGFLEGYGSITLCRPETLKCIIENYRD